MTHQLDDDAYGAVVRFAGTTAPLAVVARRINALERATDDARAGVVRQMRNESWTWQEIGDALGVTHQAARTRFRARGIN